MKLDVGDTFDSLKEGTKEVAETAQEKTSEFQEKYVSRVLPDCGKYGDAAKFAAEMLPGVTEYNAIREGDWKEFAVSAGIDGAAVVAAVFTAGAGYVPVETGGEAARVAVKVAVKEVSKEVAEHGGKEVVKELAEKEGKKLVEAASEKLTDDVLKDGVKEVGEKAAKEVSEYAEKVVKETSQIEKNKMDGIAREEKVMKRLMRKYGKNNVLREQYIRDATGEIIKDVETGTARRLDFVVTNGKEIIRSIEVTSEEAPKEAQMLKEGRILEYARENGGAFIKDLKADVLYEIPEIVETEIVRLK